MIQVTGILKDPTGNPTEAKIRITSETSVGENVKSTVHNIITGSDGSYSFGLVKGIHLIEVKVCDTYEMVGRSIVDDSTPTPVTLPELLRYTTPVPVDPPTIDDPDWDNVIDSTVNSPDSVCQEDREQIRDGDTFNVDLDSICTNERLQSGYSQSSEIAQVTDTLSSDKKVAYSDGSNQKLAIKEVELKTDHTSINEQLETTRSNKDTQTNVFSKLWNTVGSTLSEVTTQTKTSLGKLVSHVVGSNQYNRTTTLDSKYTDSYTAQVSTNEIEHHESVSTNDTVYSTVLSQDTSRASYELSTGSKYSSNTSITHNGKTCAEELYFSSGNTYKDFTVDYLNIGNLIQTDSIRNQVTINGQLILNGSDYKGDKGDTIFEVYQYSVDGLTNWKDNFFVGAIYRRQNQSVNGVIDPTQWSPAYKFVGVDGSDGDTVYIEYSYAPMDQSDWHSPMQDGDVWRKERTVTDGVPTSWSTPSRIKGTDGTDGNIYIEEYQYSIDGLTLWHSNFVTGDHYRRTRLAKYPNGTAIPIPPATVPIEVTPWSPAEKIVPIKGEDYFDGELGSNGAGFYTVFLNNGVFPTGAQASIDFQSHVGRPPTMDDHLTYATDPTDPNPRAETKRFNGTTWVSPAQIINGDLLVKGTITGDRLVANTISGNEISSGTTITAGSGSNIAIMNGATDVANPAIDNIRFAAGVDITDIGNAPFRVTDVGKLYATDADIKGHIQATSGTFTGTLESSVINGGTINGALIQGSIIISTNTFTINAKDSGTEPRYFWIPNTVYNSVYVSKGTQSTTDFITSSVLHRVDISSWDYTGSGTATTPYQGGNVQYYVPISRAYDSVIEVSINTFGNTVLINTSGGISNLYPSTLVFKAFIKGTNTQVGSDKVIAVTQTGSSSTGWEYYINANEVWSFVFDGSEALDIRYSHVSSGSYRVPTPLDGKYISTSGA